VEAKPNAPFSEKWDHMVLQHVELWSNGRLGEIGAVEGKKLVDVRI